VDRLLYRRWRHVPAGAGLIAAAVVSRAMFARRWVQVLSVAAAVVGIALVAISSEAIAWWICLIWIACTLTWFLRGITHSRRLKSTIDWRNWRLRSPRRRSQFHFNCLQRSRQRRSRGCTSSGSISAGIGREHASTWPDVMGAEHRVQVVNLSRAGATIADTTSIAI